MVSEPKHIIYNLINRMSLKILGISCYYHDAAAALIVDGKIAAATQEERLSRIKNDPSFPEKAISFCLKQAGITARQLDYVVFYEKPFVKFERIIKQILATYPQSNQLFRSAMKEWVTKKLWIKQTIAERVRVSFDKILFCDHHLAHAASAFYPSPYQKAAILTLDGVGEWSVGTYGVGEDNQIKLFKEMRFPHSLGLLYSVFTAFLGFEVNEGEYKVMGMAPYGRPRFVDKVKKLVEIFGDGSIRLDLSYFTFHSSPEYSYNDKFERLFGRPRDKNSLFFTDQTGYPQFWGDKPKDYAHQVKVNQYYADIAASIQTVTEEIILTMCRYLANETGLTNLCLAGGVALNSVANGKIVKQTPFRNLFIQPAAGDSGGSLGAALYVYHQILGRKKRYQLTHGYYGQAFRREEIERFLKKKKIIYTEYKDEKTLIQVVAQALVKQKVVGWFQGRSEWGPRALGNRSILADPRRAAMKDVVNSKIKFREPYRPFAPAVLMEKDKDYFAIDDPTSNPARFMIIVVPTNKTKANNVQAVNHMGTSRLQTVDERTNRRYFRLIKEFGRLTGVPVILNTSFNLRGEPIVNSPEDAFNTFIKSGLDVLVLERFVVRK